MARAVNVKLFLRGPIAEVAGVRVRPGESRESRHKCGIFRYRQFKALRRGAQALGTEFAECVEAAQIDVVNFRVHSGSFRGLGAGNVHLSRNRLCNFLLQGEDVA